MGLAFVVLLAMMIGNGILTLYLLRFHHKVYNEYKTYEAQSMGLRLSILDQVNTNTQRIEVLEEAWR